MQQDISQPAAVLHVDRLVQSQHLLERFTVHPPQACQPTLHDVDDIARDEADREKDQDTQDEQSGDDQQQPPDDVGSHVPHPIAIFPSSDLGGGQSLVPLHREG